MEGIINIAISGGVFIWMLRIERHVAEIKTTCKLKGGCADGGSEEES
jgi:hypothetical protein